MPFKRKVNSTQVAINKKTSFIDSELLATTKSNNSLKKKYLGNHNDGFRVPRENEIRPKFGLTTPNHSSAIISRNHLTQKLIPKIVKTLFIQRFFKEMSLQFSLEESITPLVSFYLSFRPNYKKE